jgi:hypothetical protein
MVIFHIFKSSLVLTENHSQLLIVAAGFNIRHDCVSDHPCILAKAQGTESLLQLRS